jgi:hypothetical protein
VTSASAVARELSASWSRLGPGDRLTVVKLRPDGTEAARYPGEVMATTSEGWLVVRARWALDAIDLDGLTFDSGDELQEWFSPRHPFNSFTVLTPEARLKGWYANVTHLPRLELTAEMPELIWHDLYIDLVGFPDGRFVIRDDDELRDARLERTDPPLYQRIVVARTELIRRFTKQMAPFGNPFPVN